MVLGSNATANIDFSPLDLDVHFQPGQQELSRDIAIFDDDIFERKEIFIARLMSPVNGVIEEPSDAVITIQDDEGSIFAFNFKEYTLCTICSGIAAIADVAIYFQTPSVGHCMNGTASAQSPKILRNFYPQTIFANFCE